jgi:hypothetical protein
MMASTGTAAPAEVSVPAGVEPSSTAARPKRRSLRIRARDYPVILPSIRDPRLHVAAVLLTLQLLGQTVLDFRLSVAQILVCLAVGALMEFVVAFFKDSVIMWPASGMLTGNSTAFILRVPGTLHGQWWSLRGIWIFVAVVAFSMASKYVIRWRGRHIFNPSNLGLVLAFVALGPQYTEPQDLWWIQIGPWMLVTYAILIGGGLLIGWELRLLGLELGFMAGFAAFTALALIPVPDHCMVASWHVTPMCGWGLWQILVTSPEVLIFALFMVPDPRTVPDGQAGRFVFGVLVALLSVLLLGPTVLEFWTKTAILASLVIACAMRFALARLLAPLDAGAGRLAGIRRMSWRLPAAFAVAMALVWILPVSAELSTHGPEPAAGLSDRSTAAVTLQVGSGPGLASWTSRAAAGALPPPGNAGAVPASAHVWILPPIPTVTVAPNVTAFDPTVTPQSAAAMANDVVLDLIIESEARRSHDVQLAQQGASGDGLKEFTDVISDDVTAGQIIQKTYSFDRAGLTLYLPKFSTQAPRLVGVSLHGTATLTTWDASGNQLSQTTTPYSKSWGLSQLPGAAHQLIVNDYSDLSLA